MRRIKKIIDFVSQIVQHWNADNAASYAAALAYYALFALAPLFFICITICSLFLDRLTVENQILGQISNLIGQQSAVQISDMIHKLTLVNQSPLTLTIGGFILLSGASGVFTELQTGLNAIWRVQHVKSGFLKMLEKRFLAVIMVFVVALILMLSLFLSIGIAAISSYLEFFSMGTLKTEKILDFLLSFGILTILFGMIFKLLPELKVPWNGLWGGASVAALLFTLGKMLVSFYITRLQITTHFGIASSIILILIWIYYSAQILFLGAEFTKVLSKSKA